LGLALVFLLSAVPGNFSYAQGRYMREAWRVPKFYPKGFDGYGKIETIERNRVVIADTTWKFAPGIKFATPGDRNAGIDAFSVGDTVAYLLNNDREITSLWYIELRK
jgi:hypothetical protein